MTQGIEAASLVNYLAQERKKQGKSISELAVAAGLPKSCISCWERHERVPSLANAVKWARALNCDLIVLNHSQKRENMYSIGG